MKYTQYIEQNMVAALEQAKVAASLGEIPVGAVVVKDGQIIAKGYNTRERDNDITGHAEINAIREAERVLGDWRLAGCDMFVTMEPCPMCIGAIIASRIGRLFYGCNDPVAGACKSVTNIYTSGINAGKLEIYDDIMADEASAVVDGFFNGIRE